jgi:hypothetical protein
MDIVDAEFSANLPKSVLCSSYEVTIRCHDSSPMGENILWHCLSKKVVLAEVGHLIIAKRVKCIGMKSIQRLDDIELRIVSIIGVLRRRIGIANHVAIIRLYVL